MADQLVSNDPNWGGAPSEPTMAHISAEPEDRPVTLGDLRDDPGNAISRIGTILKKDVSDPRLWIGLAASYFAPKMLDTALPIVARAAANTKAVVGELATPSMAKDLGITALGDSRVNAGLRVVGRVRSALQGAQSSETAPPSAPAVPSPAPTAAPPVAPASTPVSLGKSISDISAAFKSMNVKPNPVEINNAVSMMKFGKTAEEAAARVIEQRTSGFVNTPRIK